MLFLGRQALEPASTIFNQSHHGTAAAAAAARPDLRHRAQWDCRDGQPAPHRVCCCSFLLLQLFYVWSRYRPARLLLFVSCPDKFTPDTIQAISELCVPARVEAAQRLDDVVPGSQTSTVFTCFTVVPDRSCPAFRGQIRQRTVIRGPIGTMYIERQATGTGMCNGRPRARGPPKVQKPV